MTQQRKIQHLLWRAGFGLSPDQYHQKKDLSISQVVNQLFDDADRDLRKPFLESYAQLEDQRSSGMERMAKKMMRKDRKQQVYQLTVDWMRQMASNEHSDLSDRMSLFWHGHFACGTKLPGHAYQQLSTIRQHALGNFRDFVKAIAHDAAMIKYLNNKQNKKESPNENFARELMELFTIGRGNYSEQDVKEAARAFTGWSANYKGEFDFKERKHDFGKKAFMGEMGYFDGDEIIDIILKQKATAVFITKKIYRYFVNEKVDENHVAQLANQFYASNYDIKDLMRTIFMSQWFYDAQNIGTKIKSPVDLLAGMVRSLKLHFQEDLTLHFMQKALGQRLFNPPNVAGWAGGKSWIDNSTLMLRLNLATLLFQSVDLDIKVKDEFEDQVEGKAKKRLSADVDLEPLKIIVGTASRPELVTVLNEFLLQADNKIDHNFLHDYTSSSDGSDYFTTVVMRLMNLPEYQLC